MKIFKSVLALAIPIAFQSLIQSSLSIIDQIMVSRLGGEAMAAAGLGLRPLTILFFLFLAIAGSLGIFVAQFWGDNQPNKINTVLKLSLKYGLVVLLPLFFISLLFPQYVMSLFSKDNIVIKSGAEYLKIVSFSFGPLFAVMILSSILKSCGKVRFPVIAGVIAVVANTILNYILIYGVGPISGLGLKGAALATVLARVIEVSIIVVGIYKSGILKHRNSLLNESKSNELEKKFRKVSFPLIFSEMIFIVSITFYAVLYGRMGTIQMAAMTVLFPLQNVAFGLFAGLSTAASTLIGQSLGRGDFSYSKLLAKKIMGYTFGFGSLFSIVFILLLPLYLKLFSLEINIYKQAYSLVFVALFVLPFQLMNMVIYEGVLRTGGETAFLVKIQLVTLWSIGIPAGIITGFVFKLSLPMVFLAVSFEELVRFTINYIKMRQGSWVVRLTT